MNHEAFNQAVIDTLRERDRPEVAEMSELFDGDMASMSSATVAGEMDLPLTEESVEEVADAREWWYDEHYSEQVADA